MTFENPETPAPEEKQKTYGSDMPSLRQAAEEISTEPEVTEVLASEDAGTDITLKEAKGELNKHRQRIAEEQEAVRVAMGVDVPEPTETEMLAARVQELESSRSSTDVDAHYEHGRQQLQAAHQAQHQVEHYRNQLIESFRGAYPEISSLEDIRTVASYDPDRAAMAVQDLQQAEQALVTQQQAVVGQQSLAAQALAAWGGSQDEAFIKAHPELRDDKARAAAGKAAIEVLKESGLSDQEISYHWQTGTLRSAAAQNLLLAAARHHLGKTAAKKATPKAPRALRPGVGGTQETHGVKAASDRLSKTGSVRDAAKLYSLRKGT